MSLDGIKVTERQDGEDTVYRYEPQQRRGGAWVRFGLEEFRLPALGLYEVQELEEDVRKLEGMQRQGAPTPEQWASAHKIIWASLRRNYPTIEVKDVMPLIDLENVKAVLSAVFGVSGYRKEAPGEAQPNP